MTRQAGQLSGAFVADIATTVTRRGRRWESPARTDAILGAISGRHGQIWHPECVGRTRSSAQGLTRTGPGQGRIWSVTERPPSATVTVPHPKVTVGFTV